MRYRITSGRFDVPDSVYNEFEAVNDEEAERRFQEAARKPENAWDTMMLFRTEQKEIKKFINSVRLN